MSLLSVLETYRQAKNCFMKRQKDLFALSVDYDKNSQATKDFYANTQNKLEFAIIGKTAAEIVTQRVDSTTPNLGLTSWSKKSGEYPLKSDTKVAKNYLNEKELKDLNLLTNMLLEYVENLANRGVVLNMSDWGEKVDEFLQFNNYDVLQGLGSISNKQAQQKAELEYKRFKELKQKSYASELKPNK